VALGQRLYAAGLRGYRKHWRVLGRPDFAWPGLKVAVFVDGCFWHGCLCKTIPKTNRRFWVRKIDGNRRRDHFVTMTLRRHGWKVIRIRECAIRSDFTVRRIAEAVFFRRTSSASGGSGH
jgi:DNA mismatch endonuclease, patch repair protein